MAFPEDILDIVVELYYDGDWQDITSYVYSRDSIQIKRGRADESASAEPGSCSLTLNNRDGRFSPRNPSSPLYGKLTRNTPVRVAINRDSYLSLPVATGSATAAQFASTPDAAALDITGDIDIRFDADLTTWREDTYLVAKWDTSGDNRSYALVLVNDGTLSLTASTDGTAGNTFNWGSSTATVPIAQGRIAVRVTVDASTGSGRELTYYTADTIDGTWTQLGDAVTGSTVYSAYSGSGSLKVGNSDPTSVAFGATIRGKVYAAQVRDGIDGTVVANPDFTAQSDGATSFNDSTGKTWTVSSDAEITTKDVRFTGEVSNWPVAWDISGTDIYTQINAAGILRRYGQGTSAVVSTMRSAIDGLSDVVAYWPLEDGENATRAASGLDDGQSMSARGTPGFAQESGFECSNPVITLNNANYLGIVNNYSSTGDIQVRFLMHVSGTSTTNNASIIRITTAGTANRWDLRYGTGGSLSLEAYNTEGAPDTLLTTLGPVGFNVDDKYLWVQLEMAQNGSDIDMKISTLEVGETTGGTSSTSLSSQTLGRAKTVILDVFYNAESVGIGHVTVQSAISSLFEVNQQLNAYRGETAGDRIKRLCEENDIDFQGDGDLDDSVAMGAQLPKTVLELIRESADADLGLLYEPRDFAAIGYRPRSALYNQPTDLELDYSAHELSQLVPTEDDQSLRNDITVTRTSGSSYRASKTTGELSTAAPPDGVGIYSDAPTVNVNTDAQLPGQAGWRLALGTVPEARYPVLYLNLANAAFAGNATLTQNAATADVGSRVTITNPPDWLPPEDISQLVQGSSETLSQYEWSIDLNASPHAPYDNAGQYDATLSRYTSDGSELTSGITDAATSVSITTASGPVWTHDDGDFNVMIGGEVMTVTAISGTSSPQTFTMTRGVNGVAIAHSAGDAMELYPPTIYVL